MYSTLFKLLIIGTGGFVGSVFRFLISGFIQKVSSFITFPIGTLSVNLIGCFLFGFFIQLAEARNIFTGEAGMFVFVGVLGGFTTFSTFSNGSINLMRAGDNTSALISLSVHIIFGLGAIWLGRIIALGIWK